MFNHLDRSIQPFRDSDRALTFALRDVIAAPGAGKFIRLLTCHLSQTTAGVNPGMATVHDGAGSIVGGQWDATGAGSSGGVCLFIGPYDLGENLALRWSGSTGDGSVTISGTYIVMTTAAIS